MVKLGVNISGLLIGQFELIAPFELEQSDVSSLLNPLPPNKLQHVVVVCVHFICEEPGTSLFSELYSWKVNFDAALTLTT